MHVGGLEQYHKTNILPTMWAQKLNKLDDGKIFSILKKGVRIDSEKIMEAR